MMDPWLPNRAYTRNEMEAFLDSYDNNGGLEFFTLGIRILGEKKNADLRFADLKNWRQPVRKMLDDLIGYILDSAINKDAAAIEEKLDAFRMSFYKEPWRIGVSVKNREAIK